MAERRRQPVIEFVGVPGAGKSTLVLQLRKMLPATLGPQLPPASRRASTSLYAAAAALFLSIRPLSPMHVHRCLKIVEAHNVYRQGLAAPLLLEQGLIQRLWAVIEGCRSFSPEKLEAFMRILAQAPPDVIVRVNTPHGTAAQRIRARPLGNSRYERMAESDIIARLGPADAVYDTLVGLFRRHSHAAILDISGEDPVNDNAVRIEAFLRSVLPDLTSRQAEP